MVEKRLQAAEDGRVDQESSGKGGLIFCHVGAYIAVTARPEWTGGSSWPDMQKREQREEGHAAWTRATQA